MNILEFSLLVGTGSFIAGFLGSLTGLGGGIVIVPLLTLGFDVDIRYASGASLVSVIATSSGAAVEEIIAKQGEVKAGLDDSLTRRLANYHIGVDDISLVDVHFSDDFEQAVEAKQIAEQEVKRAEFVALKASKETEVKVNLVKGEAEVQRLLDATVTTKVLQKQAIDKWDGKLPLIFGKDEATLLDLSEFTKAN